MRTLLFGMAFLLVSGFAADRDLAGSFAGDWKSGSGGSGGAIHFTLQESGGTWKSDGFTLEGAEVPCKTVAVKMQDGKLLLAYDFEIQGYTLRSTVKGDNGFTGTYDTATPDGSQAVDSGTWKVARKP